MNTSSPTIRFLLVPLLAVSLGTCRPTPPSVGAMAGRLGLPGTDCCRAESATICCGAACCQAPAPKPSRTPSDLPKKRADDRPTDGKLGWLTIALADTPPISTLKRDGPWLAVPPSCKPSLITQHIRLQI